MIYDINSHKKLKIQTDETGCVICHSDQWNYKCVS